MKKLLVLCVWMLPITAQAQTVDYVFRIYAPMATAATSTNPIPAASVICNQTPPTLTPGPNPNKIVWDDPAVTPVGTRTCIYTDNGTGPLLAIPTTFTSWEGTLTKRVNGVETAESNRAPFSRTEGPPTNVRVGR